MRLNSVLKSIHSLKTLDICLLFDNPPNSPRREQFETSFMGAMGCDGGARSKRASALTLL
ncbi:hypothetical protein [Helicobacter pylori]